jgi:hypothetical protein
MIIAEETKLLLSSLVGKVALLWNSRVVLALLYVHLGESEQNPVSRKQITIEEVNVTH